MAIQLYHIHINIEHQTIQGVKLHFLCILFISFSIYPVFMYLIVHDENAWDQEKFQRSSTLEMKMCVQNAVLLLILELIYYTYTCKILKIEFIDKFKMNNSENTKIKTNSQNGQIDWVFNNITIIFFVAETHTSSLANNCIISAKKSLLNVKNH